MPLQPSYEQEDEIFQHFIDRYPNLKCIARHVRYVHSGSENSLKAFMWYEGHTFESKLYTFNILDRVGGGDAFASGLIYAMMHDYKPMDMVNFAVASSAIKHTIHGDAAPRSPYRHLELCGVALSKICRPDVGSADFVYGCGAFPFGGRCLRPHPRTDEGRVCGDCLFTAGSGKLRRGEGTPPYI